MRGLDFRTLTLPNGNAMHHTGKPMVIVHRIVLRASIVPKRHGALRPTETTCELWPYLMPKEVIQNRSALLFRHFLKSDRMGGRRIIKKKYRLALQSISWAYFQY